MDPDGTLDLEICEEESAEAILNMSWLNALHKDRLYWCGNNSGQFTVRNCFAVNCYVGGVVSSLWSAIWKSPLNETKKVCLWHVLAYALPTKEKLCQGIAGIESAWRVLSTCSNHVPASWLWPSLAVEGE